MQPENIGQNAKCKQCMQSFTIAVSAAGPAAASVGTHAVPPSSDSAATTAGGSPLPHLPVRNDARESRRRLPHLPDAAPSGLLGIQPRLRPLRVQAGPLKPKKLQEIEIPASFWGQTEKKCPNCHQSIQAAASPCCRHCGTEFKTARPARTLRVSQRAGLWKIASLHRNVGIVLLILAVISCTAPSLRRWGHLVRRGRAGRSRRCRALQATICRIAVGLAIVVTILMIVLGVDLFGRVRE